ncbi:Mitochondrial inner membrane organizing system component [Blastocladiella emersonii ATCC 22665]|nr:Mitochondrial inner membrane organizing system component [Blastocladiella emersonii ATCC 22665]
MNSEAGAAIPAEEVLARKWDRCLSNFVLKVGAATSVGIVTSVLLFRKRTWPVALSSGIGLGIAYEQCQRSFDPNVTLNAVRVPKPTTPPTA